MLARKSDPRRLRLRLTFDARSPAFSLLAKQEDEDARRSAALALINVGHMVQGLGSTSRLVMQQDAGRKRGDSVSIRLSVHCNEIAYEGLAKETEASSVRDKAILLANIGATLLTAKPTTAAAAPRQSADSQPAEVTADTSSASASETAAPRTRRRASDALSAFLNEAPFEIS